jgi:hypothetical protein
MKKSPVRRQERRTGENTGENLLRRERETILAGKAVTPPDPGRQRPPSADGGRQLGNGSEQVRNQPVVGNLEDRRFRILVDRNDHL